MTDCIRREGSEWTMCRCEPCKADMARKSKLRRNGRAVVLDQRDQAWARIQRWDARGYTGGVIAAMTGLAQRTVMPMLYAAREGRHHRITHATARRILAAPERPTDGKGWIPSLGTVRRLRALTVMGWSMADLAARCDVAESTLHALRNPKHTMTRPRFAAAVAELYEQLSMTHGPCRYAATRARKKGWAPPLAWNDIDNPAETPDGIGSSVHHLSVDDIEWFLEQEPTATAGRVAERFGLTRDAVQQCARRAERFDVVRTLARNAEIAS